MQEGNRPGLVASGRRNDSTTGENNPTRETSAPRGARRYPPPRARARARAPHRRPFKTKKTRSRPTKANLRRKEGRFPLHCSRRPRSIEVLPRCTTRSFTPKCPCNFAFWSSLESPRCHEATRSRPRARAINHKSGKVFFFFHLKKYKNNKLQAEPNYNATAAAAASPPPRRFTVHHPRTAAAAVNRRPPRVVSPPLPSSSARACARATPTDTLTSAAVVAAVVVAAVVVAAAADVADAGARTRTWGGEWETGNWALAAN